MKRIYLSIQETKIAVFLLPAILLGISWGIFLHGYWLIDFLPVDSKRLLLATILVSMVGAAGYILLFHFLRKRITGISRSKLAGLVGTSVFIGSFLFFAMTDRWQVPTRYFTLLLPQQTIQVSIPPGQDASSVSIVWIKTSLGDLSYDSIEYKGWKRETDRLVLTDPANNSLRWSGKTGKEVQITFNVPSRSGEAILFWGGQQEVVHFSAQKNTLIHSFDIPWYASREWVLFLGVLNFIFLCFPVCLLVWSRGADILFVFEQSLQEGKTRFTGWEWAVMAAAILLALMLRVPNLENLFPGVDEYYQLIAAKQITQGISIWDVYQRSLWLITFPVSLIFRVFGYEVWAARLLSVVFNALAIIPLYLVARKINRSVAALSVLLYATSPWIITFGRVVREYAYYPFIFYWVIYGMILFLEQIPDRFRLERDWKILFHPKLLLLALGFLLPPLYGLYIDVTSTFKLILIAYAIFALFLFAKMDLKSKQNLFLVLLMAGAILIIAFVWLRRFSVTLGLNFEPIYYFIFNPPQQWYFDRFAFVPLAGLLGVAMVGILLYRVNFTPLFLLALYCGFISFFMFSSNDFFGTRHLSTTQLWYVILMAIGLNLVWIFLQSFSAVRNTWNRVLTAAVVGVLVINGGQSFLPITNRDPNMPISKDYHYEMGEVHRYLINNVKDGDILVDSVYHLYSTWRGEPQFRAFYRFYTTSTKEDMLSIIDQNPSGWIVIDDIRLRLAVLSPVEAFSQIDGLEYIGQFGDEHVWHWRKQP